MKAYTVPIAWCAGCSPASTRKAVSYVPNTEIQKGFTWVPVVCNRCGKVMVNDYSNGYDDVLSREMTKEEKSVFKSHPLYNWAKEQHDKTVADLVG